MKQICESLIYFVLPSSVRAASHFKCCQTHLNIAFEHLCHLNQLSPTFSSYNFVFCSPIYTVCDNQFLQQLSFCCKNFVHLIYFAFQIRFLWKVFCFDKLVLLLVQWLFQLVFQLTFSFPLCFHLFKSSLSFVGCFL